ncbi:HAMP domain-containing protein [Streptomyces sp. TRM 70351]|uniref:HAMP domain-containing protein n=1 Tax=Streptomyces sp. TRM 70351 TaxID=3116552 RepID=UPI002E7B9FFD|nr:HAMP domain-containing protein [Streptomyces sp. TRM 70351]MEE1929523.1 HAMP domain-containing protein [Streptomyces sp. TRM 70351]
MSLLGGIRPPIAVLSVLLLTLAAVTAFSLGSVKHGKLPDAVLTSQQHFAEDGAIALRASLDESVTDLARAAALFSASAEPVPADAVLDKIGSVYQKWRGTAVIEIRSGRLLAARGETLPLTVIDRAKLSEEDGLAPRMVRLSNGETRLLSFALLSWEGQPQQLLVASSSLRFPGIALGKFRSIAVVDSTGKVLSSDGIPEPEQVLTDLQRDEVEQHGKQLATFAAEATKRASGHPLKTKEPGSGGFTGISGSLLGEEYRGDRAVAGYAALAAPKPGEATMATGLGLTVVAMVHVAEDPTRGTDPLVGLGAAAALLVIGALAVTLLLGFVQRPLLRLFLESRRLVRGDLRRPVTVPRTGETARIGTALERLRQQLLDDPGTTAPTAAAAPRWRRAGGRGLLLACGFLLLAWSAPLALLINRADTTAVIPQQLVNDQRERTDTLTDRVRRALNEGHADLTSVASLIGDRTSPEDMRAVLDRTAEEHGRYASLYVLTADGEVLARTGEEPRHTAGEGPADGAVAVLNDDGKEPVIAGFAEVPGRDGAALVGEFRIDFLNSLLEREGLGQVRVVDAERRVIGGNTGYLAFDDLPSARLDALVEGTSQQVGLNPRPSGVLYRDDDGVQLAAAAPFVGGGAAKDLGWTVVSWKSASALAIPEYKLQNRTVLSGLLVLTAAVACLGWLHIIVVRPLRQLAAHAEALADGDRRTVLYPRHHDEVGAVLRSLELLRQQLQNQQAQARRDTVTPAGRN